MCELFFRLSSAWSATIRIWLAVLGSITRVDRGVRSHTSMFAAAERDGFAARGSLRGITSRRDTGAREQLHAARSATLPTEEERELLAGFECQTSSIFLHSSPAIQAVPNEKHTRNRVCRCLRRSCCFGGCANTDNSAKNHSRFPRFSHRR